MVSLADAKAALALTASTLFTHAGSWSLQAGGPTVGITERLNRYLATCSRGRPKYAGARNRLRTIALSGIDTVLCGSPAGETEDELHVRLRERVILFRFLSKECGMGLVRKLSAVRPPAQPYAAWPEGSVRVWNDSGIHLALGNEVDRDLKSVFCGSTLEGVPGGTARMAMAIFRGLGVTPVAADVRVACLGRPALSKGTPHRVRGQECERCTSAPPAGAKRSVTAVDLIGYDARRSALVLIEVKTYKGLIVDQGTLRRHNLQLWLTWIMFMMSHPGLTSSHVTAVIAVLLPAAGVVQYFHVSAPPMTDKLKAAFPLLNSMCAEKMKSLTPVVTKPKVKGPYRCCGLYPELTFVSANTPASERTYRRRARVDPKTDPGPRRRCPAPRRGPPAAAGETRRSAPRAPGGKRS